MICIAPQCRAPATAAKAFCAEHAAAPVGQRGGWISAFKRRMALAPAPMGSSSPAATGVASVPEVYDASNVAPKLWVGAKPPTDRSYPGIDMIVLCAAEYQPAAFDHFTGRIARVAIPDDHLSNNELRRTLTGGAQVAEALRGGKRVLVTCQMGINRSALVAALALVKISKASPDEVIELIRMKRDRRCLYNAHFRDVLARFAQPVHQRPFKRSAS